MKKAAISIFILCLSTLTYAQIQDAKSLNDLAWSLRKEYPDSTIFYANKAFDLAKKENNHLEKTKALNFIGIAYDYKGDYFKSLEFHNQAKELSLLLNDSIQYAHSLNSIGRLYYSQGAYIDAYEMYFNALSVFQKTQDLKGIAYCYNSLAELYMAQNNFVKAEEMVRNTISIRSSLNDKKGHVSALIELAKIQNVNEAYIEAYESYLEAENLASKNNSEIELVEIKLGIANLYLKQKNFDRGLVYANDAFKIASSKNNINLVSHIKATLGQLYFLAGDFNKSEFYLTDVLKTVEKSSDLKLKTDAYFYLSKIKENLGEIDEAYQLFKLYTESKEALDNSNKARVIERLEGRIEIEKREQENEALRIKQIQSQALIERQFIITTAVSIGLLLTSLLLIVMYLSTRRKKKANILLEEKNNQIEAQNNSLEELNSEKDTLMNIVAHDLQSPINNIKSLIKIIDLEGGLNEKQVGYSKNIDQLVDTGKNLIQDLLYVNDFESNTHKLALQSVNVDQFVNGIYESYLKLAEAKNISINLDLNCSEHITNTDQSYLQRILDNLISNAIKFTHVGKKIEIGTYKGTDGYYKLKIKDQGQGFSEEDKKHAFKKFKKLSARPTGGESSNGLGLAIVKILCGRLDIDIELKSEIGQGSEFILTFNH